MTSIPERPLQGVRVLDMSRFQPGANLTRLLADLGADVVKVEPPGRGAPERSIDFTTASLHHSKRSLALDTRSPGAVAVLERLVSAFDVVVESAAPGSLDARQQGYEHFRQTNPRIIWCAITGFGSSGPYAQTAGHDINYLAQSGLLSRLAGGSEALPDQPDVLLAGPLAALVGVVGILAALHRRDRNGEGAFIDNAIADAPMWLLGEDIARAYRGQAPWDLGDPARATYRCADGRRVSIASAEPRTWLALCEGLGVELGETPGGPPAAHEATRATLAAAFATQPASHWVSTLAAAAVTPCNDPVELADDPQVRARGTVVDVERNGVVDRIVRLAPAFITPAGEVPDPTPAPEVGADTAAVLSSAGFTEAEIASLRAEGVVD